MILLCIGGKWIDCQTYFSTHYIFISIVIFSDFKTLVNLDR